MIVMVDEVVFVAVFVDPSARDLVGVERGLLQLHPS